MSQTTLDRISVAQLPARYSITRSVVYDRLNDLEIKSERQGNKAYINAEQLDLLDRLHEYIQAGGITADFIASARQSGSQSARQSGSQSGLQSAGQMALDAQALTVLGEMMTRFVPAPDPLANLRAIQEACDQGWWLSTSQLAPLLGVKSLSGQIIERYGFRFTRMGRNGAESAWRVEK